MDNLHVLSSANSANESFSEIFKNQHQIKESNYNIERDISTAGARD